MPITRRQFELRIDADLEEWMHSICSFLEKHPDQAFSLQELSKESDAPELSFEEELKLGQQGKHDEWSARRTRFNLALQRLVENNAVSEREVAGVRYYATGRYALLDILTGKVDPYPNN